MREKNKYNLTFTKIRELKVGDREKLREEPNARREEDMWEISETVGSREDFLLDAYSSIEIRIYDEDSSEYPGEFQFELYVYAGLSKYEFEEFYSEGHQDLQEAFLVIINRLIDNGVLKLNETD